jgi:cell division protein ZapA (FtsZ GTPase activity inhibitor)
MTDETVEVTIAGSRIRVPIYIDHETTLSIADKVDRHIAEIEARASRIDTHAFALTAAFQFAALCEQIEAEYRATEHTLIKTLHRIRQTIYEILSTHGQW